MNINKENSLEKHYTPVWLLEDMNKLIKKHYGSYTSILENSAGEGAIIDYFKDKNDVPITAYDINNTTNRTDILETDYLKAKVDYVKGRVAVINPPFSKGLKFVYKALEECDYCVALLSSNSFLNIDYDKYEVDEIWYYKSADFITCKQSVMIIAMKKKIKINE